MNVRPPICISVSYLCPQRLGHTNACSYRVILHQSIETNSLKIQHSFKHLLKIFISFYLPSNNCRHQNSKRKITKHMLLTYPGQWEKIWMYSKVGKSSSSFNLKWRNAERALALWVAIKYIPYPSSLGNRSDIFLSLVSSSDAHIVTYLKKKRRRKEIHIFLFRKEMFSIVFFWLFKAMVLIGARVACLRICICDLHCKG